MGARGDLIRFDLEDRIATITINRPEKKNAINNAASRELYSAFERVREDTEVWIAILTGEGDSFSSGRDLVERAEVGDLPGPTNAKIYELMRGVYKPTISAINGWCIAAATGFAFSMDIRIAEVGTRFMWPHAKRGIASVSGPGVLARIIPENIAFEYMFTGKVMSSDEALRWGLVNHVVPDGTSKSAAMELAREMRALAPLSMRAMKEARLRTTNMRVEDAYIVAKDRIRVLDDSYDKQEGLMAFKEKRDPVWRGR